MYTIFKICNRVSIMTLHLATLISDVEMTPVNLEIKIFSVAACHSPCGKLRTSLKRYDQFLIEFCIGVTLLLICSELKNHRTEKMIILANHAAVFQKTATKFGKIVEVRYRVIF